MAEHAENEDGLGLDSVFEVPVAPVKSMLPVLFILLCIQRNHLGLPPLLRRLQHTIANPVT
jgi:hypothetical protein